MAKLDTFGFNPPPPLKRFFGGPILATWQQQHKGRANPTKEFFWKSSSCEGPKAKQKKKVKSPYLDKKFQLVAKIW
jgi:hypothetical protein